jgi:hypothetical protein
MTTRQTHAEKIAALLIDNEERKLLAGRCWQRFCARLRKVEPAITAK